jgi:signal transduction histidine kinase
MQIPRFRKLWLSWSIVGLLALLCIALAIVQNRWIYQLSVAERDRLHATLQGDLTRLGQEIDRTVSLSCAALTPSFEDISRLGSQMACTRQYQRWKETHERVFGRIGLVIWNEPAPELYLLDLDTGDFAPAAWPARWSGMRRRFEARQNDSPVPPLPPDETAQIEFPLYGSLHGGGGRGPHEHQPGPPPKEDWLIVEVSLDHVHSVLPKDLLAKYDVRIVADAQPSIELMAPANHFGEPEASVGLLDTSRFERPRGPRGGPSMEHNSAAVRWRLQAHQRGGSLDSVVSNARLRNIILSGGILLLILTMVVVSLHYSRRSQQLAALQMNFVAGVSHELRTPLTVIRTAAYNLRGKVATRPDQVEKYGQLIQNESEKLSVLVEQVLRYGSVSTGRVIGERRPVEIETLIESSVDSSSAGAHNVEKHIDPGLPVVLADELALKHALQNLVDNAVKYGLEGSNWIGIFAEAVSDGEGRAVEIRVADRGPGIPAEEQVHLFDAFVRGKRAVEDQVHGTGLGLNLVKSIIEAHGGTIRVNSQPPHGAEFIVRIPAAPEELQDVFANTIS